MIEIKKAMRYLDRDENNVTIAVEYEKNGNLYYATVGGHIERAKGNETVDKFESFIMGLGGDIIECCSDGPKDFWDFFDYDDEKWVEAKTKITFDL